MAENSTDDHPDREALQRFALGLLGAAQMTRMAAHLATCALCAAAVPENERDRLIDLLRRPAGANA